MAYLQEANYRNDVGAKEWWASAAPSASTDKGPYNLGDRVWNTAPTSTGTLLWVCTTAGADGSTAVFTALTLP
jgi:hypothetical protein